MNSQKFADVFNILTIKQLCQKYPAFTESSIRWHIHCSKSRHSSRGTIPGNGFDQVMIHVGKRIYIDEGKFIEWLKSHSA